MLKSIKKLFGYLSRHLAVVAISFCFIVAMVAGASFAVAKTQMPLELLYSDSGHPVDQSFQLELGQVVGMVGSVYAVLRSGGRNYYLDSYIAWTGAQSSSGFYVHDPITGSAYWSTAQLMSNTQKAGPANQAVVIY